MIGLHTIVCLKVVPKSEEVTINPETRTLDRSRARSEINGPDMNALEAALDLKATYGGRISVLSMGPPFFERYLRLGLAMGADAAYLMSDRAFGGADTLATSYALAQGIRAVGDFDLVLCGEESSDGATGQVPPGIAEGLSIPQVTYVSRLQFLPRQRLLRARRELGRGFEVVQAPLPCVVSVKLGINDPRFLDFQRWDWAMEEAPVTVWAAADLGLDEGCLGLQGSATTVAAVAVAPSAQRRRELLTGTPQEEAEKLLERIKPWIPLD
ncbi:MAG: electron transfer flavoprotein subunit beta/FixA family protein [Dehalococcoidia bacterium]